jgi:hypothetical protein
MAYNPFDDVIDQDPAYAVRDIPLGQTPTETGFQPVGEVVHQGEIVTNIGFRYF